MSIIRRLLGNTGARAEASRGPESDFWYNPVSMASSTGIRVNADTAMKLSAVWRCNQILCGAVAMLPLNMYQRRADGGKDSATTHPLFDVLHDRPNRWQTSYEWRSLMMHHLLMRGNGYSQIIPGLRGAVDQLEPLHPDTVIPEQQPDRSIKYRVQQRTGPAQTLFGDEVFHLRGLGDNGVVGMAVLDYARETFGLGLAQEQYGARFFSQSGTPGGAIEVPNTLSDVAFQHMKESWAEAHSGLGNSHKPAILEQGAKFNEFNVGLTAQQVQLIEAREFTISDIARWFGIPPHMIGETTKETSWGSGIEQMSIGFVVFTLLPWLKMIEQRISHDLILATNTYFAEFVVDGLLRGDAKSRAEAFQVMRQNGVINADEWRGYENLNPIADGTGQDYWRPANFVNASDPAPVIPPPAGPPAPGSQREQMIETFVTVSRNGATAGGH